MRWPVTRARLRTEFTSPSISSHGGELADVARPAVAPQLDELRIGEWGGGACSLPLNLLVFVVMVVAVRTRQLSPNLTSCPLRRVDVGIGDSRADRGDELVELTRRDALRNRTDDVSGVDRPGDGRW